MPFNLVYESPVQGSSFQLSRECPRFTKHLAMALLTQYKIGYAMPLSGINHRENRSYLKTLHQASVSIPSKYKGRVGYYKEYYNKTFAAQLFDTAP